AVVQAIAYDDWGAITATSGTAAITLGLAGGIYDPDTGLVHFGARDYDAQTGRWTSKEPVKTAGVINPYEYAGSDPINGSDVDGLADVAPVDTRAILDSICGPDSEGTVHCTTTTTVTTTETIVAAQGTSTDPPSDTLGPPAPGTDVPGAPIDGNGAVSR